MTTRNGTEKWEERRVLVTGATGLIGGWLVRDLVARGASVTAMVLDNDFRSGLHQDGTLDRCAIVNGDLADYDTVERALNLHEVETVFHLGAQTLVRVAHRSPLPTFEANIRGTYNLLEACRRLDLGTEVVVASSDKAYGPTEDLPYLETHPLEGIHPYEVSKTCADLISTSYARTFGMPISVSRFGNVFGGGDVNWDRIVPGTVRALLGGRAPVIRSDGTFVRDYVYVEDVVSGYFAVAEALADGRAQGEAFNFSYERPLTVLEVVKLVAEAVGRNDLSPVIQGKAQGEIHSQYLSAAKARQELGWAPRFDLESGMRRTIEWYRAYLESQPADAKKLII